MGRIKKKRGGGARIEFLKHRADASQFMTIGASSDAMVVAFSRHSLLPSATASMLEAYNAINWAAEPLWLIVYSTSKTRS